MNDGMSTQSNPMRMLAAEDLRQRAKAWRRNADGLDILADLVQKNLMDGSKEEEAVWYALLQMRW